MDVRDARAIAQVTTQMWLFQQAERGGETRRVFDTGGNPAFNMPGDRKSRSGLEVFGIR
jgi:hypothetical protein